MKFGSNSKIRLGFSVLFTGIYMFVALFSARLHNHTGETFFPSADGKKTEKSVSRYAINSDSGDCLACHFLVTAHSLIPEIFSFRIDLISEKYQQNIASQETVWANTKLIFQLRGPPSNS